jgi:F-type H+-transporting ATPase subunit c
LAGNHPLAEIHNELAPTLGRVQRRKEVKRFVAVFLTVLGTLLVASPAFAQEGAGGGGSAETTKWVIIGAAFGMAIASAVCGYSQSKAIVAACEGLARNPGARPGIQFLVIVTLALIESMALYTFAIVFTMIFGISKVKIG